MDPALGRRGAGAALRFVPPVGEWPRRGGRGARRPRRAARGGRSARKRRRRADGRGPARGGDRAHADGPGSAPPAGMDVAAHGRPGGNVRRGPAAARPRSAHRPCLVVADRRAGLRRRRARRGAAVALALGRSASAAGGDAGHAWRDRLVARRVRRARGADELAAGHRSRRPGGHGSAGWTAQRLDPGLGCPRAGPRAEPPVPVAHLPSAARHPRVLGEPAPARRDRRARAGAGWAGAGLQRRASREPHRVGPRCATPRPSRERRSRGRLRGRRVLRRGGAPLDPAGPPARAGDAVPALRPAGLRPVLAAAHARARRPRRGAARAAGPLVRLSRGHRGADGRGGGGAGLARRPASARDGTTRGRSPPRRRSPGANRPALPPHARVRGRGAASPPRRAATVPSP